MCEQSAAPSATAAAHAAAAHTSHTAALLELLIAASPCVVVAVELTAVARVLTRASIRGSVTLLGLLTRGIELARIVRRLSGTGCRTVVRPLWCLDGVPVAVVVVLPSGVGLLVDVAVVAGINVTAAALPDGRTVAVAGFRDGFAAFAAGDGRRAALSDRAFTFDCRCAAVTGCNSAVFGNSAVVELAVHLARAAVRRLSAHLGSAVGEIDAAIHRSPLIAAFAHAFGVQLLVVGVVVTFGRCRNAGARVVFLTGTHPVVV